MARTALQFCQDAAAKLGLDQPSVLFSSSDRTAIELRRALVEAADMIVRAHDWQALKVINTHTGDGVTTEFAVPSGFLRMPKDAQVWSSRWQHPLSAITPEDWLHLDVRNYDIVIGAWTIYGGNFVYNPALVSGETARFFYISDKVVTAADSTTKAHFTADDDTFRLDDRVLELCLVWIWRAQKSLDYAEEQAQAEMALSRAIEADKGARILKQRQVTSRDAKIAYPLSVTT